MPHYSFLSRHMISSLQDKDCFFFNIAFIISTDNSSKYGITGPSWGDPPMRGGSPHKWTVWRRIAGPLSAESTSNHWFSLQRSSFVKAIPHPRVIMNNAYCQISNIRRTSVGNSIVDNSDVVGASPVGAAPTTSSFSTKHLVSIDCAKTTARRDKKHLNFAIWCVLY